MRLIMNRKITVSLGMLLCFLSFIPYGIAGYFLTFEYMPQKQSVPYIWRDIAFIYPNMVAAQVIFLLWTYFEFKWIAGLFTRHSQSKSIAVFVQIAVSLVFSLYYILENVSAFGLQAKLILPRILVSLAPSIAAVAIATVILKSRRDSKNKKTI